MKTWAVVGLLAVIVAGGFWSARQAEAGDRELPVYVLGAERMVRGEEIYRRGAESKAFTYPPFFALPFVPLAAVPRSWQAPVFFAVNFAVLLLVLRWLHRWWGSCPCPPSAVAFWLITALLTGRHVSSVFENQSHDLLVLGLAVLTAAAWCGGGSAAGAWAGLGAACKATPLLFVELFALRRGWRAVAWLLLAAALATLVPDWILPRQDGGSWVVTWYEVNLRGLQVGGTAAAGGAWHPHSFLNQSLSGTLMRLLSDPATPGSFVLHDVAVMRLTPSALRLATLAAQALVLVAIAWGALRAHRRVADAGASEATRREAGLGEVGLVLCGMVLLSPQSSKSHFCVLLLPAAFCVRHWLVRRDPLLLLLLLVALLLGPLSAKGLLGSDLGNRVLAWGSVTWSSVALLLATVRGLGAPTDQGRSTSQTSTT